MQVQKNWGVKPLVNLAIAVVNTMQAATFSFNFLLYCVVNVRFRRTCHDLLLCRPCLRRGRQGSLSSTRLHVGSSGGWPTPISSRHKQDALELVATSTAVVCNVRSPYISSRKRPSSYYGRTHV